mmetsp:Transcript_65495/g.175154  ORF Transcript_65495/g.175154 Transcript_65495/m.175154 type:complete len:264 (+) Transcript_65495:435-1226(+)
MSDSPPARIDSDWTLTRSRAPPLHGSHSIVRGRTRMIRRCPAELEHHLAKLCQHPTNSTPSHHHHRHPRQEDEQRPHPRLCGFQLLSRACRVRQGNEVPPDYHVARLRRECHEQRELSPVGPQNRVDEPQAHVDEPQDSGDPSVAKHRVQPQQQEEGDHLLHSIGYRPVCHLPLGALVVEPRELHLPPLCAPRGHRLHEQLVGQEAVPHHQVRARGPHGERVLAHLHGRHACSRTTPPGPGRRRLWPPAPENMCALRVSGCGN